MRYLSDEWLSAADEAVRSAVPPAEHLVIDQHVDGVGTWRTVIGPEPRIYRVQPATTEPRADACFTQSREIAQSVAQGTRDAHQAFLLGEIGFEGNINVLIERRDALRWLHQVLAPVMAKTTWK